MTAVQRIADLFRPDRQRRHWPNSVEKLRWVL